MFNWIAAAATPLFEHRDVTWLRTTRSQRCPICDKPDWCTIADDRSIVCCMRIESEITAHNRGWIHRLTADTQPQTPPAYSRPTSRPTIDVEAIMRRYEYQTNLTALSLHAAELGLTVQSLRRLGCSWSQKYSAWAFPMFGVGRKQVGIRLRRPDGQKYAVRGSRSGIFVPFQLTIGRRVFIAEGPTDTAALLDLGFDAIGRPSCRGNHIEVIDFIKGGRPEVIIVGDADGDGRRGALELANDLVDYATWVKVIYPPRHGDMRAWLQAGATPALVNLVIDGTRVHRRREVA